MSDKTKPAFDAFAVETTEGAEKPFYRSIGAAWPTKANNGALMLSLKVLPVDGRILLLPYREKPPKEE